MKTSYKKLYFFLVIIILILSINSFIYSFLGKYKISFFLIILLIIFKYFLGFEKDHHRYTKDIIGIIVIILLAFFILYYLSGFLISFARNANYLNYEGFKNFIFPIVLITILKEILRYQILVKIDKNKKLYFLLLIVFCFLDLTNIVTLNVFTDGYKLFMFIVLGLIPSISNNICASYISFNFGYKPNILWLLVIRLYSFILRIVPNTNDYINSLILLFLPLIILYFTSKFKEKSNLKVKLNKNHDSYFITLFLIFLFIMIYFVSGYFKYMTLAIATGSMMPEINIGDVVIVEKSRNQDYEVGDVIAYNYHNVLVVHRIIKIESTVDGLYYYTKGDNNDETDNYIVYFQMIVGGVKKVIPYIGLPAVWLYRI